MRGPVEFRHHSEQPRADQHAAVVHDVLHGDRLAERAVIRFILQRGVQRHDQQTGHDARQDERRNNNIESDASRQPAQQHYADRQTERVKPLLREITNAMQPAGENAPAYDAEHQSNFEQGELLVGDFLRTHTRAFKDRDAPRMKVGAHERAREPEQCASQQNAPDATMRHQTAEMTEEDLHAVADAGGGVARAPGHRAVENRCHRVERQRRAVADRQRLRFVVKPRTAAESAQDGDQRQHLDHAVGLDEFLCRHHFRKDAVFGG